MIWQPSGQMVLSRVEGIVMSMKGFREMRCFLVYLKLFFSDQRSSQLTWMVPVSSLEWSPSMYEKHLNLGSLFRARLILVDAPLYSILLSLWNVYTSTNYATFGISFSNVILWVQLLNISVPKSCSPSSNQTPMGFLSLYRMVLTAAFTLMVAPQDSALWARMLDNLPLPPSTYPQSPFLPNSNSPITWCNRMQAVEVELIDRFSPMIPSVANVALSIQLQNHLFKTFSTDEVTNFDRSKGWIPLMMRLFRNKYLSFSVGFWIQLYGSISILLSQKSQMAFNVLLQDSHASASFRLNLEISALVLAESPAYISRYFPAYFVGVSEDTSLKWILSPLAVRSRSLMMLLLNRDNTQENLENLNPGTNSSVTAAPPTKCLFSRTRTFFPALERQLAATSPLCPAPTMIASYTLLFITASKYLGFLKQQLRSQSMSNKTSVTKVVNFLGRVKTRLVNFVHYKILSNKKSLLLIGGDSIPEFRQAIIDRYSSNWKIASLSTTQSKTDLHVPFRSFTTLEFTKAQEQVQKFTKLYDSIVVLPSKTMDTRLDNPQILESYFTQQPNQVQLSLVAYKLASKLLTPNGVIILTGSQKAFFGQKGVDTVKFIQSSQCSMLNAAMGERDYTDVNSYTLMALTDDLELHNVQASKTVVELIKNWSEGSQLPYPGSFAKIVTKDSVNFPQFF